MNSGTGAEFAEVGADASSESPHATITQIRDTAIAMISTDVPLVLRIAENIYLSKPPIFLNILFLFPIHSLQFT